LHRHRAEEHQALEIAVEALLRVRAALLDELGALDDLVARIC